MTHRATKRVIVPPSESVLKMLAHARAHRDDPIPVRGDLLTAFDHRLIGRGHRSEVAVGADRVTLCDPGRPCAVCQQRTLPRPDASPTRGAQ